jgi:hypothetical protein
MYRQVMAEKDVLRIIGIGVFELELLMVEVGQMGVMSYSKLQKINTTSIISENQYTTVKMVEME